MKTFEMYSQTLLGQATTNLSSFAGPSAQSYTNTPLSSLKRTRWWHGWIALIVIIAINAIGLGMGHGPALTILSLPVLLFLNEGFQQTEDQDATRKCALEAFAKGAVLGPPVLALAETVGGVVLALICFGRSSFESIVNSAAENAMDQPFSFSTRLFREASVQDPVGAAAFALFSSLLVAGLCEEAFKMGIAAWQVLRFRAHKKTLNPVVVMAGVGLGLAYSESVVAVASLNGTAAARVASERVLTSFPVHIFCAVWTAKRASTAISWIGALLPAAISHGLFDFGLIICSNFSTRLVGLGWSFTAAAATTLVGVKS